MQKPLNFCQTKSFMSLVDDDLDLINEQNQQNL